MFYSPCFADIFYFVIEIKSVGRIVFWRHLCKYRHDFASFDGIFRTSWICGFGSPDAGYTPADCPLSSRKEKRVLENYGWILAAGSCLGVFNLWLGSSQLTIAPSFQLKFLFDALRAGLFEEILFRTLLYALCIEVMGKIKPTPAQTALCLLIMILPHVLIHFSGTIEIGSLIVMSVAFGLPFALLQWKVNLSAAIGAHALVDLIRFIVFGA